MVCKAIIEQIVSDYKVKVRIPTFHRGEESVGCTPSIDIPTATICVPPSIYPSLKVKDVVFVDFEDDNVDKPVVMGVLFSSNCYNIKSDIKGNSLIIDVNAKLPKDTTIGEVTSQNIQHLTGLNNNAQKQLDNNDSRLKKIEKDGCGETISILQQIDKYLKLQLGDE